MTVKLLLTLLIVVGLISNSTEDDIEKRLKSRYNSLKKCKNGKPAFQCSGIMMRGVNNKLKLKYAWNMKDMNKQKHAFSLAYLRRDQKFSSFPKDYDSGFIVYPHSKTPRKKNTYKVYCSFPMDGYTDYRAGHGCGKYNGDIMSNHCARQNIKSFVEWKLHFLKVLNNPLMRQCGFDMTKKSAAKYFDISIKANNFIQKHIKRFAFEHNELRMHSWNEKKARKIPIEAFFYLMGSARGKQLAEKYQDQFYSRGGGKVPIVGIRMPTATKSFKVKYVKRKPRKLK